MDLYGGVVMWLWSEGDFNSRAVNYEILLIQSDLTHEWVQGAAFLSAV